MVAEAEASQATLIIPAVNDSLHNRLYVCRITTPYGTQEGNMTIAVTGMIKVNSWYDGMISIMQMVFW